MYRSTDEVMKHTINRQITLDLLDKSLWLGVLWLAFYSVVGGIRL